MSRDSTAASRGVAGVGLEIRERPILFSGEMVRAILEGRKTQTRRVIKPQPTKRVIEGLGGITKGMDPADDGSVWYDADGISPGREMRCPFGRMGDRLWVRETWQYINWTDDGMPFVQYRANNAVLLHEDTPEMWAERLTDIWAGLSEDANYAMDNTAADRRWRSPRFMPRWASRLTLEITGVRVERLRSITGEDARAEGVADPINPFNFPAHHEAFAALWDSLNGPRGYGWAANPWVWCLTFQRVETPIRKAAVPADSTEGERAR